MIPTPTTRQQHRDLLVDAILFRVEREVEDVIATLPPDTPPQVGETIRQEMLPHTEHTLSALTLSELLDENALQVHIQNVIASTQYLVNRYQVTKGRS